jgi:hypothetical protein
MRRDIMPSIFKHAKCPACGHRHHFCFAGEDHTPDREYKYVCPETAKKAVLRPSGAAEIAHIPPQGGVALVPVQRPA